MVTAGVHFPKNLGIISLEGKIGVGGVNWEDGSHIRTAAYTTEN